MHSRNTTRSQNQFLGRNSVSEKSVRLVTVNAHGTMNRTGASPPRLLVECKHWNKAVGTDEIGAFIADLQDAKLTSGIVLSRRGAPDGETRILNYHQRAGGFVLSFSERDIERVCNGANLASIILDKMKAITFQKRAVRRRVLASSRVSEPL